MFLLTWLQIHNIYSIYRTLYLKLFYSAKVTETLAKKKYIGEYIKEKEEQHAYM